MNQFPSIEDAVRVAIKDHPLTVTPVWVPKVVRAKYEAQVEALVGRLVAVLTRREADRVEMLMTVGVRNFGVHPPLVREVVAELELGEPLDETTRAFIRSNFVDHINHLRQEAGLPPIEEGP